MRAAAFARSVADLPANHTIPEARGNADMPELLASVMAGTLAKPQVSDAPAVVMILDTVQRSTGFALFDRPEFLTIAGTLALLSIVGAPLLWSTTRRARSRDGGMGLLIDASLNEDAIVQRLVRLAVPAMADWCVLFLVDENGGHDRIEAAHRDPSRDVALRPFRNRQPARPGRPTAVSEVIRHGTSTRVPEVQATDIDVLGRDEAERRALRALDPRSLMIVPLPGRGRTAGVVVLGSSRSGRRYRADDLARAEVLGRHAGLALDNAHLHREAQHAKRAKADFLAVMSHELRTPLNVVLGYSDLLLLGVPEPIPDPMRPHVERMRVNTYRLLGIIEEILAFARVEAMREELRLEVVELGELTREAAAYTEPVAEEKGLTFHVVTPAEPVEVLTDAVKVRQILSSLLSNAVKFTERGEVRLEVGVQGEDRKSVV